MEELGFIKQKKVFVRKGQYDIVVLEKPFKITVEGMSYSLVQRKYKELNGDLKAFIAWTEAKHF